MSSYGSKSTLVTDEKGNVVREKQAKQRKCYIFFSVLFFLTTVVFLGLFLYYFHKADDEKLNICTTRDCVTSAGLVAKKMDFTADPCDDFSLYACGQYYKDTVLPEGRTRQAVFDIVDDDNMLVMKGIVEAKDEGNDPQYLVNMKRYYRTCMDEVQIEKVGVSDYLASQYPQAFPTLNSAWDAATFNLNDNLATFENSYFEPLFVFYIDADSENSSANVLYLSYPSLGLDQEYFVNRTDPVLQAYETYLTQIAVILGADETIAKQDMKDVVDLMKSISNLKIPRADQRNSTRTHNPTTLGELKTRYPWLDIKRAVQASFGTANITLQDSQPVNNNFPEYFDDLKPIIEAANNRTVQNMFSIIAARRLVGGLTKALRAAKLDFDRVSSGKTSETPRWQQCVSSTGSSFGRGMGRQFVNKMFSQESKTFMNNMIDNLEHSFKGMLEENAWMTAETKKAAAEKLASIGRKIGYPETDFDDAAIDNLFATYTMTTDNFYMNLLIVYNQSSLAYLPDILKPVDKTEWSMETYEVNAYYSPSYNEIVFPAGILQSPFYSPKFLDAMNYGGIGVVIGHEITHGFDDQGSQYDKDGNLKNWWQPKDKEEFEKKTQCIVDQYSKYKADGVDLNVNGELTQGENVADNGGLKESFRAYQKHVEEKGKQQPLPGLDLTLDQLFFLSYAQVWCEKRTLQSLKKQIYTDPHSPGKFRILGALQNSNDFAAAYNCPVGSKMNPKDKCVVW